MDRARLLMLVASALLATSVTPFAERSDAGATSLEPNAATEVGGEATDVQPRAEMASQGSSPDADEIAIRKLLARLQIRHTALPVREREALARTIVSEARLRNLDPELVIAVIEVESGGYHLAVSHVGAMGLMQLLPATAEELAGKHDIDWNGPDTLFDPTTNVKLGTAYLRELADRYGDVSVALAAYNWGPGRIDRRLRQGAGVPSRYIEQVMRALDRTPRPVSRRS